MYYSIEDLRKLVLSLSGTEKRHYSIAVDKAIKSGDKAKYLKLYPILANPGSDLSEISAEFSTDGFTNAKNRLLRSLLKHLRDFHYAASEESLIQDYLGEIEILYHHNLPGQCGYLLHKAYLLAKTHEKFGLLLQVLEWERRISLSLNNSIRPYAELVTEEKVVLAQLVQIKEIEAIYCHAKDLKKQYGYVKGQMKKDLEQETIKAPGMPILSQCKSDKARYYYYYIHALYYWMTFDHQKAYTYSIKLIAPDVLVVPSNDYMDGILEHVTSCVCCGMFDAALNGLAIAEVYIEQLKLHQSHAYKIKLFYYQASYQLIIYNYTGNVPLLTEALKMVEKKLKQYDADLNDEAKQVILGNMMNAYLGTGNIVRVEQIWEALFQKQSQEVRRDIYDDLYFFRLFLLLQHKAYDILPSKALSANRHFKKLKDYKTHFEIEYSISSLLMKDHNYENPEIRREVLEEVKKLLLKYTKNFKGAAKFQEHYSLYVIWAESLMSGKAFNLEAAKWYERFRL